MENSSSTLGGGLSPEDEQAMKDQVERVASHVVAALRPGVQETPTTTPAEPVKLDEADLLKYQLLGSRVESCDLRITMYQRELHHAQIERAKMGYEVAQHVKHLEAKYSTDLRHNMVSEDGYLIPRPAEQRLEALRRG